MSLFMADEIQPYNENSEPTFTKDRWIKEDEDRALEMLFRVMHVTRWVGIAPYRSLQPPRVSRALDLYGKTLSILCGGIMIASYSSTLWQQHLTTTSVLGQVSLFWRSWCEILCNAGIFYVGIYNAASRLDRTFGFLKSLNMICRSIGSALSKDPGHRQTCLFFAGTESLIIMLALIHCWVETGISGDILHMVFKFIGKTLTIVLMDLVMLQFIMEALTINLSFRTINHQLDDIPNKARVFGAHQLPHMKVRSLASAYVATCRMVRQHNESDKALLVLLPVVILINLLNSTSFFLSKMKDGFFSNYTSLGVVWYILHVCRLMLLVAPSYTMNIEIERTHKLIRKLMHIVRSRSDPLLAELEMFQLHLSLNKPAYVVMGLYSMRRSLILVILAVCTTYVMIFQEF